MASTDPCGQLGVADLERLVERLELESPTESEKEGFLWWTLTVKSAAEKHPWVLGYVALDGCGGGWLEWDCILVWGGL